MMKCSYLTRHMQLGGQSLGKLASTLDTVFHRHVPHRNERTHVHHAETWMLPYITHITLSY